MVLLKLYGHPQSPNVRRVTVVLLEKEVPFEFVDVERGELKSAEYLKLHPFGQIPCIVRETHVYPAAPLDDDGFILYESQAICHYLASKYPNQGTPLLPTELKANSLFHQAVSVFNSDFNPHAVKAVYELHYKPLFYKAPTNKEVADIALEQLGPRLDVYDQILGKQKYVAGDEITLADLYHLPYAEMLGVVGSNVLETRPNVARWFKEISSRPSWQAVKVNNIKAEKTSKF